MSNNTVQPGITRANQLVTAIKLPLQDQSQKADEQGLGCLSPVSHSVKKLAMPGTYPPACGNLSPSDSLAIAKSLFESLSHPGGSPAQKHVIAGEALSKLRTYDDFLAVSSAYAGLAGNTPAGFKRDLNIELAQKARLRVCPANE